MVRSVLPRIRPRLFAIGAEARLYRFRWRGRDCVLKYRPPKTYRHPELDHRLRLERTQTEVRMLSRLPNLGIKTPSLYANLGVAIIMERVRRRGRADPVKVLETLHTHDIVHGDYTPRNFLGEYLIDFGLSSFDASLQKKAEDLLVATHAFGPWFFDRYSITKVKDAAVQVLKLGKYRKGFRWLDYLRRN